MSLWMAALALAALGASAAPAQAAGQAVLTVKADVVQAAGVPVRVQITLTDTGQNTYRYFAPAPGDYPDAIAFEARVTSARGARVYPCWNGKDTNGLAPLRTIKPGASVSLPALFGPLPAGEYRLAVVTRGQGRAAGDQITSFWPTAETAKPLRIVVRSDPALRRRAVVGIVKRIRRHDIVAERLLALTPLPDLEEALLRDLLSSDPQVAESAAGALSVAAAAAWYRPGAPPARLPSSASGMVRKALERELRPGARTAPRAAMVSGLLQIARVLATDELVAPLHGVLQGPDPQLRTQAVVALGGFRQEAALRELRSVLHDPQQDVRGMAATELGDRGDPAALEPLLAIIKTHHPNDAYRPGAFMLLAHYPRDPRVRPVLEEGLHDSDEAAREDARIALDLLRASPDKGGKSR